ncbi:relaxase/mobilization nuclease domain-containing protein [Candidatus Nitrotoga sp. AM1P]|uniref:relaxase/mobilization nuclease domain-containing protein n=1 Tax=Candidatus Nitrotoga sp. AM1P TaxID=2559597 RepID=UPI0010AEFB4C|nr:relaxase/mobilization nuclease domain-containing protein [Candidatus Nitrotoga sp. AM1P]BBJ23069.1 hypothetical protein W01_09960 [Candidatus Nitrotoga sp. AM1P]
MIPFASQRGGGQDLATHLLNDYDNDMIEVAFIRGSIARDLHGAFKEWEVQADTLTRCRKYLYSMSINPDPEQGPLSRDQYLDYIKRTEDALGLTEQPRAVVFHIKHGREHCHVVWSRIDADQQRAVHIAFDRDKLMRVTRGFARDHGLDLPAGYDKSRKAGQLSLYDQEQLRQTGLSKADHIQQVTEAWRHSDDARSFVQALAERGYILATGKRPYVLVDLYGGKNALSKLIDDKSVRTKDIRNFLEKEFPPESLPTVEEAQQLVTAHRKIVEKSTKDNHYENQLAELKHSQQERRLAVEQERNTLKDKQQFMRLSQQSIHRTERDQLRATHIATMKAIRLARYENRPTGLAAFLGKVSGIMFLQKKIHQYQDARKIRDHLGQRDQLKAKQVQEQKGLDFRLNLQVRDIERKAKALEKIVKRELAALSRDNKRHERVRARGDDGSMPSLAQIAGIDNKKRERTAPDLLRAFDEAKQPSQDGAPDLMAEFRRAASERQEGENRNGSGSSLENARPPEIEPSEKPHRNRGRDRDS